MDPLSLAHENLKAQMPDVILGLRGKVANRVPDAPRREAGFSIQNAAGDEAVVRIYDEIWALGINAVDLTAELDQITAPRIRVEINSPGGDVWDGITIYNALRLHPAHVTTRVDGLAASIASVIFQAGDSRVMVASSQLMIHNAWGLTVGNQTDHQEMAAMLEQQDGVLAGIYATKSTKDAEHFRTLMNAETWLTAEAAVAEGLADEVLEPETSKAKDTLHTQIAAAVEAVDVAVTGAERVDALRAEAGKTLSVVNRESLVGLRDTIGRIDGLLHDGPEEHPDVVDARMALARRSTAFQADLPPRFL